MDVTDDSHEIRDVVEPISDFIDDDRTPEEMRLIASRTLDDADSAESIA